MTGGAAFPEAAVKARGPFTWEALDASDKTVVHIVCTCELIPKDK